jgi:hypothetical protein
MIWWPARSPNAPVSNNTSAAILLAADRAYIYFPVIEPVALTSKQYPALPTSRTTLFLFLLFMEVQCTLDVPGLFPIIIVTTLFPSF